MLAEYCRIISGSPLIYQNRILHYQNRIDPTEFYFFFRHLKDKFSNNYLTFIIFCFYFSIENHYIINKIIFLIHSFYCNYFCKYIVVFSNIDYIIILSLFFKFCNFILYIYLSVLKDGTKQIEREEKIIYEEDK